MWRMMLSIKSAVVRQPALFRLHYWAVVLMFLTAHLILHNPWPELQYKYSEHILGKVSLIISYCQIGLEMLVS